MIRRFLLIFISVAMLSITVSAAGYCACCVERGYYDVRTEKVETFHTGLVEGMKFNKIADLYMTEAGYDGIKGLPGLKTEINNDGVVGFDLVDSFLNNTWTLNIASRSGKKGVLTLPMPPRITIFKFDTRDEDNVDRGLGVSLYKQLGFTGRVARGTGIFRAATARPATYTLIFHGSGNGCDSSADFRAWRLELNGPRAGFVLLGKLDVAGA
ncbi:MAG TPA: hypothetical protein VNA17_06120 [Pyrinomonadaceae bacterium]|nr:hypothetical protein [Pyrinomonadaceae bacterium]